MALAWLGPGLAVCATLGVPLYAWCERGRTYASFGAAILLIALPGLLVAQMRLRDALPAAHAWTDLAFAYGIGAAGAHLAALVHARLRPAPFRGLVSIPAMATVASGALVGAWLVALAPLRGLLTLLGWGDALVVLTWLELAPFAVVAASVVTSLRPIWETVRVPLAVDGPGELSRLPVERRRHRSLASRPIAASDDPAHRGLRIVQIADPHLGPWQPLARLRRRLDALVALEPDLVLITGDLLTMEGAGTPGALAQALSPLRRLPGRCFAIFGNHDHEAPDEVRAGLAAAGAALLIDAEALVDTALGRVQLVGADFVARGRREHIEALLARLPRRPGHLRLLLLHDPSVFRHVPGGEVDLALSGHTHGGQVGLLSLGFDWTVLSRSRWPDHGLFGRGSSRLYVHRGTGFYGFPLRIGVPGELSLLDVVPPPRARATGSAPPPLLGRALRCTHSPT